MIIVPSISSIWDSSMKYMPMYYLFYPYFWFSYQSLNWQTEEWNENSMWIFSNSHTNEWPFEYFWLISPKASILTINSWKNVFLLWIIAFHNILNLLFDKGVHDLLPNTLLLSTIRCSIAYSVNKQELLISMTKCISSFDGYSH